MVVETCLKIELPYIVDMSTEYVCCDPLKWSQNGATMYRTK